MKIFRRMGRAMFLCILLLSGFSTFSQQRNFIYIESESRSPFYVRLGETTFSSSEIGHLIIPNLKDSSYQFVIGFPGKRLPDFQYAVLLNKRDRGFELKKRGQEDYALLEWQNGNWIEPEKSFGGYASLEGFSMKTDPYSHLLAGIVNDSAVLYNYVIVAEDAKAAEPSPLAGINGDTTELFVDYNSALSDTSSGIQQVITEKSTAAVSTDTISGENVLVRTQPLTENPSPVLKDSVAAEVVVKVSDIDSAQNRSLVKGDFQKSDSIKLETSAETVETVKVPLETNDKSTKEITAGNIKIESSGNIIKLSQTRKEDGLELVYVDRQTTGSDTILINIPRAEALVSGEKEETVDPVSEKIAVKEDPVTEQTTDSKVIMINSDCRRHASEPEIDKLRIAMLKGKTDADRLKTAAKLFRSKCFTVRQVRALSELFLDDHGRFTFFQEVYPFISDTSNFPVLAELLSSDFYKTRFRSLLPG